MPDQGEETLDDSASKLLTPSFTAKETTPSANSEHQSSGEENISEADGDKDGSSDAASGGVEAIIGTECDNLPVNSCPTYTLDELCVIQIPDSPELDMPPVSLKCPSLVSAIQNGQRFGDAGSVNTAVKSRPKRHVTVEDSIEGIAECVRAPYSDKTSVSRTYTDHVENSRFRSTRRTKKTNLDESDDGGPKICIRGFHVTEKEFVHSLVPTGHVDLNFMWICCVAIMEDWGSRTKFILNQPIIKELMLPVNKCKHEYLGKWLQKIPLKEVEQQWTLTAKPQDQEKLQEMASELRRLHGQNRPSAMVAHQDPVRTG